MRQPANRLAAFVGALVALFVVFPVVSAKALQMVSATASVQNVDLTFWVNGVAIETFSGGEFGGLPLVLWLVPGSNEVVIRGEAAGDAPQAAADVTVAGEGKILDFIWTPKTPEARVTFEMSEVPEWTWQSALAKPNAEADVTGAVEAAHAALTAGDAAAFRALMEAHVVDAAALLGQAQAESMAKDVFAALSENTRPLPEFTVEGYRDGQVYKVVGPDGRAALAADSSDGGVTNFGTFWAFVDGRWQIVR